MQTEFISLMHELADTARAIITPKFRKAFTSEIKSDKSPVTEVDRNVETALRDILSTKRPMDGVLGEEFPEKTSENGYSWVIDPIDGTKPFMAGLAHFTTLIALTKDNIPILGCIDQPILEDRWIGGDGHPTEHNSTRVRVAAPKSLSDVTAGSTAPGMFMTPALDPSHPNWLAYARLKSEIGTMTWGGDAMLYACLASGWLDLVVEADLKPHDFAALVPVIKGAGGVITDWDGKELTTQSDGRVLATSNQDLHKQALQKLAG